MNGITIEDLSHRKYGHELTPGGRARYIFHYGVASRGRIALFKYQIYKPINHPPQCIIISFTMKDFVQSAKDAGLRLNPMEHQILTAEHNKATQQGES